MNPEQDAHEYATAYARTAHGEPLPSVRRRQDRDIAESARDAANADLERQGGRHIIEAEPEYWFWGWPFRVIFTVCVGYFAWQIFIR